MNACPMCGEEVSEERPRYRVILEIEDETRSTSQFMGDETGVKRVSVDRQLCADCWQDHREKLS
ncbi:hypothetical protein [Halococcus agarilyticus]|uniref:hypothetical protein n=1 Tax=Halococcus agarilyticus TaxID=1232219 RepID=UPI00067769D7|nr:hypothetical protein [Halococcus agarilyticus]